MSPHKKHTPWRDALRAKARALVDQIVLVKTSGAKSGAPAAVTEKMTIGYYSALDRLYSEEIPMAHTLDRMLVGLEISGADMDSGVKIAADYYNRSRKAVAKLAVQMSGKAFADDDRDPVIGVSTRESDDGRIIMGLYPHPKSERIPEVREALKLLGRVAGEIESSDEDPVDVLSHIAKGDPAAIHASASALHKILPAQKGITARFSGLTKAPHIMRGLGNHEKKAIKRWIGDPSAGRNGAAPIGSAIGIVREIDLDNRSFTLRQSNEGLKGEIRCILTLEAVKLENLLDKKITVHGIRFCNKEGELRLMRIDAIGDENGLSGQGALPFHENP